jgi:NAD(P)-dependent dehydrogenase (short-subunit alcohol dehydrogenase family)
MTSGRRRQLSIGAALGVAAVVAWRAYKQATALDLRDRVVLITGGSRGLGLELAREFAARGARLALTARSDEELAAAAETLRRELAAEVVTTAADLALPDQAVRVVEEVVARYGRLDVLVNNAGVVQVGPLAHMSADDYEASLAIHFWAPFHTTQAALPAMRRQGGGRIVNVSSIGGKVAVPHLAPYCVGKFALTAFSDACRGELARDGIVVTTVCPGLMRTGSPEKAWVKGQHEAELTWFLVSDSLPGLAMHSRRAAAQIVHACVTGRAELVLTPHARAAVVAQAVAPSLVAAGQRLASRVLPAPTGMEGDRGQTGEASRPEGLPAPLVTAGDRASLANLERVEAARPPSGSV